MSLSTATNRCNLFGLKVSDIVDQHHAVAPESIWDYIIVTIAVLILGATIILCIKLFLKPGETEKDHIKRVVLADEFFIKKRVYHE